MSSKPAGPTVVVKKQTSTPPEAHTSPVEAKSASGYGAAPFLPADQHFRRQLFLAVVQGHAQRSTFNVTPGKALQLWDDTELLYNIYKVEEAKAVGLKG